ncbi:MAG: hypothetical protein JWP10_283, partial [Nocardioidaceae bacterium]|nr:hypothetical protein [Nocardioidaceae bacterium]
TVRVGTISEVVLAANSSEIRGYLR